MDKEKIGELVAEHRKMLGLTHAQLAEKIGIRRQSLIEIEKNQCSYRIDRLLEVLNGLGLTMTISSPINNNYRFIGVRPPQPEKHGKGKRTNTH